MLSSIIHRVSKSIVGTKSLRPTLPPSLPLQISRAYHENIVEHYENPRNVGSFDKNDDSVGTVSSFDSLGLVKYLHDVCCESNASLLYLDRDLLGHRRVVMS